MEINGKNSLSLFKNESGKHVVQRCPPTESHSRRQTSIIAVSILPIDESSAFTLRDKDITVKTQGGSGPGGQHQNKTESAVRMTHAPTGVSVYINGRSQLKNKQKARIILELKVSQIHAKGKANKISKHKSAQVDGANRSNKIRTYNFINNRVVDHNLGTKTTKIKQVMKGQLELLWK